ncbi:MAG TPA: PaaI family thioesterase [Candidatus Thermoplasmatota archaeon]|nr:PaaI family thioesterase [Candidatus Thermoplasmatota archaeon]
METSASTRDYSELLGIERFELEGGEAVVVLPTGPKHANAGGWVHGGVLAGLLDFALGAAVVATLGEEEWTATQSLTTDFLRPGKPGDRLVARARVDRRGKLAAFPSGEVRDPAGEVLARATGVWAVRRG